MCLDHSCWIDDKWIPRGIFTGYLDVSGNKIQTSDRVSLCGCSSMSAIVGETDRGFELFFGSPNGLVVWSLNGDRVRGHKIKVIESSH